MPLPPEQRNLSSAAESADEIPGRGAGLSK